MTNKSFGVEYKIKNIIAPWTLGKLTPMLALLFLFNSNIAQGNLINDVKNIFEKKCVSCHNDNGEDQVGDISQLAGLPYRFSPEYSMELIKPYEPEQSAIYVSVKKKYMPADKNNHLTEEELDKLKLWIELGAPNSIEALDENNVYSKNEKPKLLYSGVRKIMYEKCVPCHGGYETKAGLDLLNLKEVIRVSQSSFNPIIIPNNSGSSLTWKLIDRDSMPRQPGENASYSIAVMDEGEKLAVKEWIDVGAPVFDDIDAELGNWEDYVAVASAKPKDEKPIDQPKETNTSDGDVPDLCLSAYENKTDEDMYLNRCAKDILMLRCKYCHGEYDTEQGLNFVANYPNIIRNQQLVEKIFDRIQLNMPPREDNPYPDAIRLDGKEMKVIEQWLEIERLDPDKSEDKPENRQFISNKDIIDAIDLDLRTLKEADEFVGSVPTNIRYISFAKYYNAGYSLKEIEAMIFSLSLIINSVNFDGNAITPPDFLFHFFGEPLGELSSFVANINQVQGKRYILSRTIVRIDTTLYSNPNHFGQVFDKFSKNFQFIFDKNVLSSPDFKQIMQTLTGAVTSRIVPVVDGGIFADAVSRADRLYNEFAKLPAKENQLLKRLGDPNFDVDFNLILETKIPSPNLVRFGILESGVSTEHLNRILERIYLGGGKYYWRSYDFFADNPDAEKAYQKPLGPKPILTSVNENLKQFAFQHDGGEIIIGLKNGLQGYALTDKDGVLIDEGPTDLVVDTATQSVTNGIIVNGYSCMICHDLGMKDIPGGTFNNDFTNFFDQIVNVQAETAAKALYINVGDVKELLDEDANRFQKAVLKAIPKPSNLGIRQFRDIYTTGIGRNYHVQAVQVFGKTVDANMIAAEFGFTVDSFFRRVSTLDLGGLEIELLKGSVNIPRDEFENEFKIAILRELLNYDYDVTYGDYSGSDSSDYPNNSGNTYGGDGNNPYGGSGGQNFYVVGPGDSIRKISSKCGISVERLKELNPRLQLPASVIYHGMKLRVDNPCR